MPPIGLSYAASRKMNLQTFMVSTHGDLKMKFLFTWDSTRCHCNLVVNPSGTKKGVGGPNHPQPFYLFNIY